MLFIKDKQYAKKIFALALPVAMQNVLQSAILNFADQLMVGQLGSANVAGIGIASKFISIFTVVISAIASAGFTCPPEAPPLNKIFIAILISFYNLISN